MNYHPLIDSDAHAFAPFEKGGYSVRPSAALTRGVL
jgi:hypothetical protein